MKLIDKDALVAEIRRWLGETDKGFPNEHNLGRFDAYKRTLSFIHSLEVKEVDSNNFFIEKACEFINKANLYLYHCISEECDLVDTNKMIKDFRKYMEGE